MRELSDYIVNYETLVVISINKNKCKVYEIDETFIVNMDIISIMKNSCLYFGSSLDGRKNGTKSLIDCKIKVPILLEDSNNLIMFPTLSYRSPLNIWISYNNLLKYNKIDKLNTLLYFKNNCNIELPVKYNIIDNQIIRCIKLDAMINKRKNNC